MAERKVTFLIGANIRRFQKGMSTGSKELQRFGKRAQSVGRNLSTWLTTPIIAAGAAAWKMAADFEQSMTKVETLVGLSRGEVDRMKESVIQLSNETGKSANELADALFTITSAGARGSEAMEILERASKASAMGLGETSSIARAVTAAMQAYGSENLSAAQATDTLTAIVREGNLEAESLAPVLGRVIGLASQLGISFSEVGASIATFTRLGVSSEEAVTGLQGIMNGLIKPTDQTRDALAGVGMSFDQLRGKIQDEGLATTLVDLVQQFDGNDEALGQLIPNVRALSAVLGTAGSQGQQYIEIQRNIASAIGIVDTGFKRVTEDSMFKYNQSVQKLKNRWIEAGAVLIPIVNTILEKGTALMDGFMSMDDRGRKLTITIAAMAAALGPAVAIMGTMAKVVAALLTPLAAKIAALVVVGGTIVYITRNWAALTERFSDIGWWRNAIISMVQFFVDNSPFKHIIDGYNNLVERFGGKPIPNPYDGISDALERLKTETGEYENKFESFTEFIKGASSDAKDALLGLADGFFTVGSSAQSAATSDQEVMTRMANPVEVSRRSVREATGSPSLDNVSGGGKGPIVSVLSGVNVDSAADMEERITKLNEAMRTATDSGQIQYLGDAIADLEMKMSGTSQAGQFLSDVTTNWANSFGQGLNNLLIAGKSFNDTLRDMKKLLLSTLLQRGVSALLTGGLGGSGFFGSAGGLFGKIFGVNDALIRSNGDVVKFHPDDNLLAMKDFSNLAPAGAGKMSGAMRMKVRQPIIVNMNGRAIYDELKEVEYQLGSS